MKQQKKQQQQIATGLSFTSTPYPVGTNPQYIAIGDFTNRNGLDLAVTNMNDNTVSILLNNGNGTFQLQQTIPVGESPISIVTGRFHRDSNNLDLIVANYGNGQPNGCSISVLKGNGNGTFQLQQTISLSSNSFPRGLVVGDFNNDGHLDIAFANCMENTISVWLGKGDGTFPHQQTYPVNQQPMDIAVGKFTQHGHLDLVVTNNGSGEPNSGTISVLLGKGDGTFQPQQTYPVGQLPQDVVVGDFKGNGGLDDIAVTNYDDNTISVLLNNGNGTFQPQQAYPVGKMPTGIAVGEFTNGRLDLAVTNQGDNTISFLLNNGNGTFQPQQTYSVGTAPVGIVVGKLTDHGNLDLAVADSGDNNVMVLLQD